jgi:hypothetical protein
MERIIKSLEDKEHPFIDMQGAGQQSAVEEYVNSEHPDEEATYAVKNEERLNLLGLNPNSTAEEVRRKAIDLRTEAIESNIKMDTVLALKWALGRTKDCISDEEFALFIFSNWNFNEILVSRK